ncbi:MAG: ATP-grasp domain-containing protein [Bacteroides sp.]|nr:ATP-grasp domain-containing protein [Bacteroides sp.]
MKKKQQKLLILGGNALSCDIVTTAKGMGIYTIVTDWNSEEKSPAKKIADEAWDISLLDYDELTKRISKHEIDGIITGFTDSYLEPYAELCRRNNLHCYANQQEFSKTLDKSIFKQLCIENDIPTVPQFKIEEINEKEKLPAQKVIIKPVDSSGSKGITLVSDYSDFDKALEESLSYSKKGEVIIEQYMETDDVSMCYTLQDGNISLSAICDRYIHKTKYFGSVTSGLIYPSRYLDRYISEVDKKVKCMLQSMGLKNGVLFMQAFVNKDTFYFYEMGYRLSGGRHYIFTQEENNISALKDLIRFAITGKMDTQDIRLKDSPHFKNVYSQVSILCKSQLIAKIEGLDELNVIPGVLDVSLSYKEGDKVGKEGTTMQIVARVHLKAKSIQEMCKLISLVKGTLHIISENGEDMIEDYFQLPLNLYE